MMPVEPLDFESQLVGTISAPRTFLLPLKISFADLSQTTVIYGGGDAAIDLALGLAKLSLPVTVGSIRSDFGAEGVEYAVDGVSLSGGSSSEFQSLVSAVDPGHSRVEIRFAPSLLGSRAELAVPQLSGTRIDGTGTLLPLLNQLLPWAVKLLSNSILCQTVTGTGIPPLLAEPNPLDFGSQTLGTSSPPLAVTMTNKTAGEVTIGLLQYLNVTQFNDVDEFALVSDGCTGQTLAPGGSCQVVLRFRPTREGDAGAVWSVVGDFADTPAAHITLTGSAETPALSADPASIDFGSRPITTAGNEHVAFLAALWNVSIGALRFDGADAASFVIVDETCVGQTLQPRHDAAVAIAFAPQHIGHAAASLLIVGSDQRTLLEIPLSGIGTSAANLKVCVATAATAAAFTYVTTVTNDGPSSAVATTVWLQMPPGARFTSSDRSLTSPREKTEGILSWSIGTLRRGDSLSVTAVTSPPSDGLTIPARAWVSSATFDPDPATNRSTYRGSLPEN